MFSILAEKHKPLGGFFFIGVDKKTNKAKLI